jgi:competence protein ComEC
VNAAPRLAVAAALGAWAGVGRWWWAPVVVVAVRRFAPAKSSRTEGTVFGVVLVVGTIIGFLDARPPAPLPAGNVAVEGRVVLEFGGRWGWSGLVDTGTEVVVVRGRERPASDRVRVAGQSDGRVRHVAGRHVAATIDSDRIEALPSGSAHERVAEAMRRRIVDQIRPGTNEARGLLVGFLVGDTSGVGPVLEDEMRRSGLSHLVAVSGSNVALFVIGLMVVTAPLAIHPLGRLVVLLNGLLVFGVLTRWEPSVIRAALMAALVGLGRFAGLPLDPVTALALVAGGSVLVEPALAGSVGFQLSVVATAGLMAGARWWPGGGPAVRLLKATGAAQLAVAPLILAVFGSVPLLSPLANLVAIPLVSVATVVAGVGAALGIGWLVVIAELCAHGFIAVARVAAPWPQLGLQEMIVVVAAAVFAWRLPRARVVVALVCAVALGSTLTSGPGLPDRGVVFLDVGQGDAAVVRLSGFTVVIDGGPDPARFVGRLAGLGVDRVDLAVVTHVHEDHVAGVEGMLGRVPVGRIWAAFSPHETPSSRRLLERAERLGVPVTAPTVGTRISVGPDSLEVVGPVRRYAGPNDQSIVLVVTLAGARVLLAGDIETVAQAELELPDIDVLKVPHQGAATSDSGWLSRHAGAVAVVSVGQNEFGHPAPWVIEALAAAGSVVYRTDETGDVVLEVGADGVLRASSHAG